MKMVLSVLLAGFVVTALLMVPLLAQEPEEAVIRFEQPILITSIGQSAGAMMARVLAERAELAFAYEQRAEIAALDEAKTLIVVLGVSSKGLGAAGIDIEDEIAWATELFDRARELAIPIIVMHIEGGARRGAISDRVITLFAPQSDYLIVRTEGNEDGLFTEISTENEITMASADKTLDIVPILVALFPPPEKAVIRFGQPILITSIGQSAGAMMARVLAERAELSFVYEQRAEIAALDEAKTLIVVLGVSSKGLGAAGIDIEDEIAWATELFDRARELEIPIIVMHIEGGARRGAISDRVITLFAPQANYLIVRAEGNEDELFTVISTENEITMASADKTLDIVPILAELFSADSEGAGDKGGA